MNLNTLHNNAVAGDSAAEKLLFEHLTVSFRLIVQLRIWNKLDAEEIAQEALKTIAEKYAQITIETSFAAWAHKVLEHKMLDYFKSKRVRNEKIETIDTAIDQATSQSLDPLLERRLLECLREIFHVNKRYARILALHYQGCTTEEICQRLKISSANMYMLLSRARASLATYLKGDRSE